MSDLDLSNPYDPDPYREVPRDPALVHFKPVRNADEIAAAPPPKAPAAPRAPEAEPASPPPVAPEGGQRPAPWRAAASSVPKLRQQPTPPPEPAPQGEFQGFAQDEIAPRSPSAIAESWEGAAEPTGQRSPLAAGLPWWEAALERARALPRPVVIGVGGAVLLAAILFSFLTSHGEGSISLAKIRQHPEAYDGRLVKVQGRAGETFTVGGSFVFDLRQGRDTIVVYSRTRRPSLHEKVEATGTVSVGYLDGAPRLALFEQPHTP